MIHGRRNISIEQNEQVRLNATLIDPDAQDVTMGREGPAAGAEVMVQARCGYCTLRAPTMLFDSPAFNVTANFLEPACVSACPDVRLPVADMLEHLRLPAACRECVMQRGWEAIRQGRRELTFFASLAQAAAFLDDLRYQGVYGYNSRWVKEDIPRQVQCETADRIKPEPNKDILLVQVDDLFNTGCTNTSFQRSSVGVLETWVEVNDTVDAPTIALFRDGADVCSGCSRGDDLCCSPLNTIITPEETPIDFGSSFAIILDSPEFLNFDFPQSRFRIRVAVEHGVLRFPALDDPDVNLWYPVDFSWLLPRDAGTECTWVKWTYTKGKSYTKG